MFSSRYILSFRDSIEYGTWDSRSISIVTAPGIRWTRYRLSASTTDKNGDQPSQVMYGLGRLSRSDRSRRIQSIATGRRPRNFSGIASLFLVISRVHVFFFSFVFLEIDALVKRTDATNESFRLCRSSPRLYRSINLLRDLCECCVGVCVCVAHASRVWQFIDNAWLQSTFEIYGFFSHQCLISLKIRACFPLLSIIIVVKFEVLFGKMLQKKFKSARESIDFSAVWKRNFRKCETPIIMASDL